MKMPLCMAAVFGICDTHQYQRFTFEVNALSLRMLWNAWLLSLKFEQNSLDSAAKPADLLRSADLLFLISAVMLTSVCHLYAAIGYFVLFDDSKQSQPIEAGKFDMSYYYFFFSYWPVVFITCALLGPRNHKHVYQQTCMHKPSWLQTASVAEVIADTEFASRAESWCAITLVKEVVGST